ncbi:MAG: sigma-70 family RNA polymerase sigma factor [Firmicutes bacterium]|nr:sigma-70 family RNA polymerase sigma factor [Bacillota bacterium]
MDEKTEQKDLELSRYSPLVKSIVKRYIGKGVDYDDLYQLGCMGLVKAHKRFDEKFGVKFTTYAVPLIAGEIKRFLRDDGQIKVSRSVKGLYVKIKRYLALHQADEVQPTVDELAKEFDVTREEIIYAMEASRLPLGLFDKSDGDALSLAERLPNEDRGDIVDKIVIQNLLETLEDREKKVILLRYFRNATQSEVAKQLGISQVQVSRIEQRVLAIFRKNLQEQNITS